jgi:hypothetical protein
MTISRVAWSVFVHADRCSRVDFHSGIHIPTRALCRCSSRWSNRALISGFIARMGGPESLLGGDGTASSLCIHMAVHRVVGEGRRRDVPRETQCDRHDHKRLGSAGRSSTFTDGEARKSAAALQRDPDRVAGRGAMRRWGPAVQASCAVDVRRMCQAITRLLRCGQGQTGGPPTAFEGDGCA